MFIFYLMLFAVAVIMFAVFFRINQNACLWVGMFAGFVATIVAVIALNRADSSSGAYVTYVNGVRMTRGIMVIADNLSMFLIFGAISMGGSHAIGWMIGRSRIFSSNSIGLNVLKILVSIIGLILSVSFVGASVSGFKYSPDFLVSNIASLVAGFTVLALSIWGLVSFTKWCRAKK